MSEPTPNYIKALLSPISKNPSGRKAWSIDLQNVWIPFFSATNTAGDTAIPKEALGAPLRLAYEKDGSVKFSRNGKPTIRIAKELSQNITLVRENFVANLTSYAGSIKENMPDEYANELELQRQAGTPILNNDRDNLDMAISLQIEKQLAEAGSKNVAETDGNKTESKKVLVTA